jgi:paraquat-inducible protein B
MSARANPARIGLFLVGALALAVLAVAMLASNAWLERRTSFVAYFPESVNGLETGAPVKFQGVPVGSVSEIMIEINQTDKTFQVPVKFDIDLPRLTTHLGTYVNLADTVVLRQQVENGLRAQLQMESIVTGLLYIELAYRTDSTPPRLANQSVEYPEIPTSPSLMAAIGGGAGSVLSEVMRILNRVNDMLVDVNMEEINRAVVQSARAVEALVSLPEITAVLREIPGMTEQVNQTMVEVERLATRAEAAIDPMQVQITGASTEAIATLQALRKTLDETHGLLSADAGPGYALQGALASLRDAADALRLLITSLEQNPDMLLRGKKPPPN